MEIVHVSLIYDVVNNIVRILNARMKYIHIIH